MCRTSAVHAKQKHIYPPSCCCAIGIKPLDFTQAAPTSSVDSHFITQSTAVATSGSVTHQSATQSASQDAGDVPITAAAVDELQTQVVTRSNMLLTDTTKAASQQHTVTCIASSIPQNEAIANMKRPAMDYGNTDSTQTTTIASTSTAAAATLNQVAVPDATQRYRSHATAASTAASAAAATQNQVAIPDAAQRYRSQATAASTAATAASNAATAAVATKNQPAASDAAQRHSTQAAAAAAAASSSALHANRFREPSQPEDKAGSQVSSIPIGNSLSHTSISSAHLQLTAANARAPAVNDAAEQTKFSFASAAHRIHNTHYEVTAVAGQPYPELGLWHKTPRDITLSPRQVSPGMNSPRVPKRPLPEEALLGQGFQTAASLAETTLKYGAWTANHALTWRTDPAGQPRSMQPHTQSQTVSRQAGHQTQQLLSQAQQAQSETDRGQPQAQKAQPPAQKTQPPAQKAQPSAQKAQPQAVKTRLQSQTQQTQLQSQSQPAKPSGHTLPEKEVPGAQTQPVVSHTHQTLLHTLAQQVKLQSEAQQAQHANQAQARQLLVANHNLPVLSLYHQAWLCTLAQQPLQLSQPRETQVTSLPKLSQTQQRLPQQAKSVASDSHQAAQAQSVASDSRQAQLQTRTQQTERHNDSQTITYPTETQEGLLRAQSQQVKSQPTQALHSNQSQRGLPQQVSSYIRTQHSAPQGEAQQAVLSAQSQTTPASPAESHITGMQPTVEHCQL